MPRNGSGVYSLPPGINPVIDGTIIEADWANTTLDDVALALTESLSRNGQGGMLSPLRFADGTLGLPGAAFTQEPATGMWRAGTNDLRFSAGGVQALRLQGTSATFPGEVTFGNKITVTDSVRINSPDGAANNRAALFFENDSVDKWLFRSRENAAAFDFQLWNSTDSSVVLDVKRTGAGTYSTSWLGVNDSYTGNAVGGIHLSNFLDAVWIISAGAPDDVFSATKSIQLVGSATTVSASTGALALNSTLGALTIKAETNLQITGGSGANNWIRFGVGATVETLSGTMNLKGAGILNCTGGTAINLTATTGGATLRALAGGLSLSGTSSATMAASAGAISITASGGNLTLSSNSQITIRKAGNTSSSAISILPAATYIYQGNSSTLPAHEITTSNQYLFYMGGNNQAIAISSTLMNFYDTGGGTKMQIANDVLSLYGASAASPLVQCTDRVIMPNLPIGYSSGYQNGTLFRGPALSGGGFSVGIKFT